MTLLANRYELGRLLGSGGMARVHQATDRVLGRRVAVKLLRRGLAPDASTRARLLAEARAAARLAHRNAVAVYDAGEEDGEPYIVMEYVPGRSLADELRGRGSLPVEEALRYAGGVLAALAAAHGHGLVHRDVKPANVLLADTGEVKLADFGIAKGLDEAAATLTATGQVLGTPQYLAPERMSGGSASPRSDVYAVGVLLYEMLSGAPPFDGDRPVSVALAHRSVPVPSLEERAPSVPPWLAAAVHRALAKDPAERFASADDMLAALADRGAEPATVATDAARDTTALVTAPVGAGPSPRPDPGDQPRRQVLAAVAAVALLAAAAVVVMTGADGEDVPGPETAEAGDEPEPGGEPEPEPTQFEPVSDELAPAEALAAFAAALAGDPGSAGEKGEDQVEGIWEGLSEREQERRSEARELIEDVEEWVGEGELDPEVGGEALRLLTAVADEEGGDEEGGDEEGGDGRGPEGRGPPGQRGNRGRGR